MIFIGLHNTTKTTSLHSSRRVEHPDIGQLVITSVCDALSSCSQPSTIGRLTSITENVLEGRLI